MILPILKPPNKKLRTKCQKIKKIDQSIKKLAEEMVETLKVENGLGLAAPQVGVLLRLIVVGSKSLSLPLTVLINPEIRQFSQEKEEKEEGCLSLPGLVGVVPRALKIKVKGENLSGKKIKFSASGLFARILQHEIDHLEGILFPDRVEDLSTLKEIPLPPGIIFMGTSLFSLPILKALSEREALRERILRAVFTEPDRPVGRKQILAPSPVKKLAQEYDFPLFQPKDINQPETLKIFRNLRPDLIIVSAYGQILSKKILEIPKYGCLCLHPSLLPKYRGPSPIQFAIKNGEKETGVTIFKMDEKIDHGPIIASSKFKIPSSITSEQLSKKLANLGAELLIKTLPLYLQGKIKPKPQNHKKATYTRFLKKEDGQIDFKKSVREIERQIRAFYPWPGSYIFVNKRRIIIHKAHLEKECLVLDIVQPEGKRKMSFAEFKRGYKKELTFLKQCDKLKVVI